MGLLGFIKLELQVWLHCHCDRLYKYGAIRRNLVSCFLCSFLDEELVHYVI